MNLRHRVVLPHIVVVDHIGAHLDDFGLNLAQNHVEFQVDINAVDVAVAVHVDAFGLLRVGDRARVDRAKHDADERVHVDAVDLAVAIYVALQISRARAGGQTYQC